MTKPILLLNHNVPAAQLAQLTTIATNYELLTSDKLTSETDLNRIEIMFGWEPLIGKQLLDSDTSQLKWVQAYSAGVDDLPLERFAAKNILLSNASGVHAIQITESVIGMLLSYYRGIIASIDAQTKQIWQHQITCTELFGKSLLIVGTGQIGQHLAQVLTAFGVKVYGINRSGYPLEHFIETIPQTDVAKILPKMDIVVNILPLTPETYHYFDAERFKQMQEGVIFINVGRGPSVDSNALITACQSGHIQFAGIDVVEEEPLLPTSPLWQVNNLLITPHISGKTNHYLDRLLVIFETNVASFQQTATLQVNQVTLDLGY